MTKKILLAFAMFAEAEATLAALNATEKAAGLYDWDGGQVVITGMGVVDAACMVSRHGKEADEIWNLGIAGALSDSLCVGTIYNVSTVSKHLSMPLDLDDYSRGFAENTVYPSKEVASDGVRLLSADYPIHHSDLRESLGGNYDLIDMEGYGVAVAAAHLGKTCRLYKLVSDRASPGGNLVIRHNIKSYSKAIIDFLLTLC